MRMSTSAVIARNVEWSDKACSEPYEAGWADTAIFFVRALKPGSGMAGRAFLEISPDGMHWVREGSSFDLPTGKDEVSFLRISHFGTWVRLACEFAPESSLRVLVTLHLKS
ncbi:hypothetical protein [Mariluticola halotolerans]|uniref:hypothetical protein n=1 Tax=Mariluticola halotolerans TaxID=2909283 RepID=UPI0026E13E6C|nr:hypothetical protein [Mariluticola halotolerans]UJQ93883.1 hypothetical protein L1P08_13035 [Mariluticola halotolerans]